MNLEFINKKVIFSSGSILASSHFLPGYFFYLNFLFFLGGLSLRPLYFFKIVIPRVILFLSVVKAFKISLFFFFKNFAFLLSFFKDSAIFSVYDIGISFLRFFKIVFLSYLFYFL